MKKAVLVLAALVVFTTFTFAQASVGAWGRGLFVPAAGGDDITMGNTASWGANPRIGLTVSGTSDNIGFQVDILGDPNASIGPGDQQKLWAKLFDMLTIQIGNIFDDTLRGNACFGAWDWQRYDQIDGEDAIFVRVCTVGTTYIPANTVISLAPVEGAYIFAGLGFLNGDQDPINPGDNKALLEDLLPLGQYGAGYTIEGIGQIRAQFIGLPSMTDDDWGIINAAFKLTMVEGLMVDLGAGIPTDSDQAGGLLATIAVYANYAMDALTLHVYGDVSLYDEDIVGEDDTLGFTIAGGVDYNMEGGIGINADVRYKNDVQSGYDDGMFAAMAGVKLGFSNGLAGIGIEVTSGNFAGLGIVKGDPSDIAFCIPIRVEYWF
jgi:hypothetical protein